MKFQWSLQRLLDVTEKRELAAKAVLFGISRQIADLQQQAERRRAMLNALLADLGQMSIADRMNRQEIFMRCFQVEEAEIRNIYGQLDELYQLREEKKNELVKIAAKRDTLDRLRDEAKKKYDALLTKKEQEQADEIFQVSFARKQLAGPLLSA